MIQNPFYNQILIILVNKIKKAIKEHSSAYFSLLFLSL